ncbi:hypothetical protein HMPREF9997_02604 [Corynebacterium durum F0235]|uniref:Uncharacterized protein n=1 Tax=Corynebacterium durum F0235 TaxID=1035195 RepID=L1M9G2_9CORY|nr:hypothetical protein HMPREF9997_02604 [Corynebacterium durum F0235]
MCTFCHDSKNYHFVTPFGGDTHNFGIRTMSHMGFPEVST